MPNNWQTPLKKPPPVCELFAAVPAPFDATSVTNAELLTLSGGVVAAHGADTTNIACLVHLTDKAFRAYSKLTGVDLSPVLELQRKYLGVYMSENNIVQSNVLSAIASLERAETTIAYLSTL